MDKTGDSPQKRESFHKIWEENPKKNEARSIDYP